MQPGRGARSAPQHLPRLLTCLFTAVYFGALTIVCLTANAACLLATERGYEESSLFHPVPPPRGWWLYRNIGNSCFRLKKRREMAEREAQRATVVFSPPSASAHAAVPPPQAMQLTLGSLGCRGPGLLPSPGKSFSIFRVSPTPLCPGSQDLLLG